MTLTRRSMAAAAVELLDEVGLEGLTLRLLASKLKVQAPAIYWHFKNKQDLLDEMASTVMRAGVLQMPATPGMRWDRWAMAHGKGLRRMLLLHRDGARMISGTRLTDASLYAPMESALRTLVDAGFSTYVSTVALATIYSYVVGFVIEEQAVHPDPGERAGRIDAEKLPLTLKAGEFLFSNFDRRFADGLKLIIAGLAAGKRAV